MVCLTPDIQITDTQGPKSRALIVRDLGEDDPPNLWRIEGALAHLVVGVQDVAHGSARHHHHGQYSHHEAPPRAGGRGCHDLTPSWLALPRRRGYWPQEKSVRALCSSIQHLMRSPQEGPVLGRWRYWSGAASQSDHPIGANRTRARSGQG